MIVDTLIEGINEMIYERVGELESIPEFKDVPDVENIIRKEVINKLQKF